MILFSPLGETVHGVLFLWKVPAGSPINFTLDYFLIHNRHLMTNDEALEIGEDLNGAMHPWSPNEKHS